jgi:P27 family predicted phage terminase small subunit
MSTEALRLWRRIAPAVIELGILSELDVPAFVLMAEHYSVAMQAAQAISEDGLTAVDENGAERKHPLLQVLRDNSTAYRMYAAEFGLTPGSRGRLHVAPDAEQLSLADELFGMIEQVESDASAG